MTGPLGCSNKAAKAVFMTVRAVKCMPVVRRAAARAVSGEGTRRAPKALAYDRSHRSAPSVASLAYWLELIRASITPVLPRYSTPAYACYALCRACFSLAPGLQSCRGWRRVLPQSGAIQHQKMRPNSSSPGRFATNLTVRAECELHSLTL